MACYWWLKRGLGLEFVKQHISMLKQIINIYMRNYDRNNESSYIAHLDANNLYGWAMSQKLPVNGFKWVEKSRLSEFNQDFMEKYDEDSNTEYFLGVDVEYPKTLLRTIKIYHFYSKEKRLKKSKNLFVV